MKVIIAGSRSIKDYLIVKQAIKSSGFIITEIVSGTAQGVDRLGESWAFQNGILVKRFFPDWDKYGRSAGYRRNVEMAEYADALIAIWDGKSRGTKHMIDIANKNNLKCEVQYVTYHFRKACQIP